MACGQHAVGVAIAAEPRETAGFLHALESLAIRRRKLPWRGRHHGCFGQAGAGADPEAARAIGSGIVGRLAIAEIALAGEGLVHHTVGRYAAPHQADQRAPDGQTRDEGARAVDRIEHPDKFRIGPFRAKFLANNAMAGKCLLDHPAHHHLGCAVAFGHRIEAAVASLVVAGHRRAEEGHDRRAGPRGKIVDETGEIYR